MLTNTELAGLLAQIKQSVAADQHGGQMHYARTKMIEMGFFDTMPESASDPHRPCPKDWTAFQVAIFDNGEPPKARRKRNYIETTKTRYGGQIKVWTRDKVNFRKNEQVAWRANFYLFDRGEIAAVAAQLHDRKQIDDATVTLVNDWVEAVADMGDGWMAAIPVLRTTSAGTRWMKGHLVAIRMIDGAPAMMMFFGPDGLHVRGSSWSEQSADGRDLSDNVVAQMRLGSHDGFDAWATQPFGA
ncbi:hypothetical protein ACXY7D_11915 [Sphingomonas melonis]